MIKHIHHKNIILISGLSFLSFFCSQNNDHIQEIPLREVIYLEQVRFQIPSNWEEHTNGKGAIYFDEKNNVILQLNLLTLIKENEIIDYDRMIRDFQDSPLGLSNKVEILPNGNALLEEIDISASKMTIHWQIAHHFPPNSFKIAAFTYEISIPIRDKNITRIMAREIRNSSFIEDVPSISR